MIYNRNDISDNRYIGKVQVENIEYQQIVVKHLISAEAIISDIEFRLQLTDMLSLIYNRG